MSGIALGNQTDGENGAQQGLADDTTKVQPDVGAESQASDGQPAAAPDSQTSDAQPAVSPDTQASDDQPVAGADAHASVPVAPGEAEVLPTIAVNSPDDDSKLDTAPSEEGPQQLEEIIVTATKTEASARDIPVSINAMKGDDLVQQGATTLEQMLKNQPSVNVSQEAVTIRGVGLTVFQTNSQGKEAGFFLGEANMIPPSTGGGNIDFDPYDLSTVEVLEGPQSTLFGGTALSGAIRYIPNKPRMGEFEGGLRMGYGSLSHADKPLEDVSAMLNVPVGDHFAMRAAGTFRRKPSVGTDTNGKFDNLDNVDTGQARILARWEITDRFSADLLYSDMRKDGFLNLLDKPDSRNTSIHRVDQPDNARVHIGSLNLTYAFDAFSIVGVVNTLKNHRYSILDAGPIIGVPGALIQMPSLTEADADVPSYELRMVSAHPTESAWWIFDRWDYIAGLYYMKADQDTATTLSVRTAGIETDATDTQASVQVSEKAFYLNLNRHLLDDRLEANIGARLAATTLDADIAEQASGIPIMHQTFSDDGHRVNPKYALTWHFTDDVNVRVSMSEGFRFGGANSSPTGIAEGIPPTFHSDSLKNYELGLRSDWFDRTVRFDLTGYHIAWSNLQVTQLSPLASSYTDNIGAATIDGLEAQFTWRLPYTWKFVPKGLTLNTSVSLLNSKTSESFDSANGSVDKGTRLPLSPKVAATFGLSWIGAWENWVFNANAQASYAGERTNALIETSRFDPYTVIDASFRIQNSVWLGTPSITLSGTNLTDEFILNFANPTTTDPQVSVYSAQSPRAVKLSLEFAF
nr:TonB-dependent receptor [Solimonas terrae]